MNIDCLLIDGRPNQDDGFYALLRRIGEHLSSFTDLFSNISFILADKPPARHMCSHIDYISIGPLTYSQYQMFSVYRLLEFSDADYIITCQFDGFPLFKNRWQDKFTEYDYIGSPWTTEFVKTHLSFFYKIKNPVVPTKLLVGNSGFSLRSRKFCEVAKKSTYPTHKHPIDNTSRSIPRLDDWFFSVGARDYFEENGVKFADRAIASQFSLDPQLTGISPPDIVNKHQPFGFHGADILRLILT